MNDVDLPLHFHTFPTMPPSVRDKADRAHPAAPRFFTSVSGFQMNLINILAAVIGAAVLERYPNIRISFGESGIGWIPYALDRMDFEWEDRFHDLGLTMKPSEYWRRQCKATFQFDTHRDQARRRPRGGDADVGLGLPASATACGRSPTEYIAEQFGHLPADVTHKIVCENAGKSLRVDQVAG